MIKKKIYYKNKEDIPSYNYRTIFWTKWKYFVTDLRKYRKIVCWFRVGSDGKIVWTNIKFDSIKNISNAFYPKLNEWYDHRFFVNFSAVWNNKNDYLKFIKSLFSNSSSSSNSNSNSNSNINCLEKINNSKGWNLDKKIRDSLYSKIDDILVKKLWSLSNEKKIKIFNLIREKIKVIKPDSILKKEAY